MWPFVTLPVTNYDLCYKYDFGLECNSDSDSDSVYDLESEFSCDLGYDSDSNCDSDHESGFHSDYISAESSVPCDSD